MSEKPQSMRTSTPTTTTRRHPATHPCTAGCILTSLVLALAALLWAPAAHAGEWVQVSCINPDQSAAGDGGWSSFANGTPGSGSGASVSCGPGSEGAYALLSSQASAPVGSAETLQYTPPAGSTLTGGQLDIGMYADGHGSGAHASAGAYTPEHVQNPADMFMQCAYSLTPCALQSNDFTGQLEIPAGHGGELYLSAGCEGNSGASCDEGASNGAWSEIRLWWANLRLSNSSTPAASAVAGTLLTAEPHTGTQELLLDASDYAGPGVYDITVQADGQTLYDGTPDTNSGACVPVGESASALMFDAAQPCKQSEAIEEPIDTTPLHDGQHTLKVTVTDAAGNSSVVYDAPIATRNAPTNSTAPSLQDGEGLLEGATLTAQHGAWSAPVGAGNITYSYQWQDCDAQGNNCQTIPSAEGANYTASANDLGHTLRAFVNAADSDGSTTAASAASAVVTSAPAALPSANSGVAAFTASANGSGASENAHLHLNGHATISRTYSQRAFAITGQLSGATGQPIAGASLDIRQQVSGSATVTIIGHASTSAAGALTAHIPAGPSRTITVAYRARSSDPGYTTTASVTETVTAGIQLHVTPRHTRPHGRIMLAGTVAGPIPPHGVVIELLVHYRGIWEPLRTPRTNAAGHFHVAYQFQGAVGAFPFRAQVLGEQAGFPYRPADSAPVQITTR